MYFNPRSPRGERLSISVFRFWRRFDFNPRSPRGERLILTNRSLIRIRISIHAPREGSDPKSGMAMSHRANFNPRSPRGERPLDECSMPLTRPFQSTLPARGATYADDDDGNDKKFQSTLPARGATDRIKPRNNYIIISIHAPREGSDCGWIRPLRGICHFNPRSPRGERRPHRHTVFIMELFQSTLPARGATILVI